MMKLPVREIKDAEFLKKNTPSSLSSSHPLTFHRGIFEL